MTTFREGDTIEIPYALLDADGAAVTVQAGDELKLLIAPKPPNTVFSPTAEYAFTFGADDEIQAQEVTVPDPNGGADLTVDGYRFTSADIEAGTWVYEWQFSGSAGDTERGEFKVERKIQEETA